MGDYTFLRYFVCSYNKWNPFSEEVKEIPDFYWLMSFQMIRLELKTKWEEFYKPTAELSASITKPENYKAYREYQDKVAQQKKKGASVDTKVGDAHYATSNAHYDPTKGLVDGEGNILIPKDRFEKMSGFDGIALSI